MTQDARIASQLGSTIDLLQETLESHRFALSLDQENADILFNTAQVLTSLAEALTEHVKSDDPAQESKTAARALLEEAFRKFSECLTRQEAEYAEIQQQIEAAKAQEEQAGLATDNPATSEAHDASLASSPEDMETSSTSSEPPEEWATVVEPITPEALLDTVIAQLGSLTTLVSLSAPADANTISQFSNLALPLINTKIPHYTSLLPPPSSAPDASPAPPPSLRLSATSPEDTPTTPKDDALLSSAAFRAALLDTSFRSNLLSAPLYSAHLAETFTPLLPAPSAPLSTNGATNAITAYAEALIDFAAAVSAKEPLATTTTVTPSTSPSPAAPTTPSPTRKDQWTALSKAQTLLARLTAPTSPLPAPRLAALFLLRGDAEMHRFRLACAADAASSWAGSAGVLVRNAGVYYRGAVAWAERAVEAGVEVELRGAAEVKAAVAECVRAVVVDGEGMGGVEPFWRARQAEVGEVLAGMVEEGLVEEGWVGGFLRGLVEE